MRAFIVHVGSDGPLFADGASLLLHGGVCGRALGKGDLSAPGPEPDSEGALGCLEERVEASRGAWWGTGRQAQVDVAAGVTERQQAGWASHQARRVGAERER